MQVLRMTPMARFFVGFSLSVSLAEPTYADCTVRCLEGKPIGVCEDKSLAASDCVPRRDEDGLKVYCGVDRFKAFDACTTGGWLGVKVQATDKDMASAVGMPMTAGVIVSDVDRGSPAENAGLQSTDVILLVDDTEILTPLGLAVAIRALKPGSTAILTIWRDGAQQRVPVTVGTFVPPASAQTAAPATPNKPSTGIPALDEFFKNTPDRKK